MLADNVVYEEAFVALPSSISGKLLSCRGLMHDMESLLKNGPPSGLKAPLLIFLPGSAPRQQEKIIADWIVGALGFIVISPNTHAQTNRPTYTSPADPEIYKQVQNLRFDEVSLMMEKIKDFKAIDNRFIVLAGLSEGAVAAACWSGSQITARLVIAWNCEPSYFVKNVKIAGNAKDTPILNMIGYQDEFFGPHSDLGQAYDVQGHGAEALKKFNRAKIIIYPTVGHRILDHLEARNDIINFLDYWQAYFLSPTQKSKEI